MLPRVEGGNWRRVLEIYESAAALPVGERQAYLSTLGCAPEISQEVLALLEELDEEAREPVGLSPSAQSPKLGKYTLLQLLGRGGMGEVYSARDTELDRVVALKFLSGSYADRSSMERLRREAKALSALNHPNIVTIHEIIELDSRPATVMEFVAGEPLRTLTGAPLPLERLLKIGEQIALALAAAHDLGIIHRDIKPENIMVRQDGYVKLLDFGLARRVDAGRSSTGSIGAGTLRYMSPEQARFESVTSASDVFSTGVVLYELATAVHPFEAASPFESMLALATREAKPISTHDPSLPPRFAGLIDSMLASDPKLRPSARNVAERLQELRGVSAGMDGSGTAARSRAGQRWMRFWFAMAAGLAVAAAAAGWLHLRTGNHAETAKELRIRPLTSQPGWEGSPALSPDGESVAFTWTERLDRPRQIYIKRLKDETTAKLTDTDAVGTIGPLVWSPDGQQIAFKRWYGNLGAIYTVPVSGGEEQKIAELGNPDFSSALDWSPDGTHLAFSDSSPGSAILSIYLFRIVTGEKRKLTSPSAPDWGDWDPKFSPDGETIAFKRVTGFLMDDIYTIPVTGGALKRITADQRGIWGHAWSSDGKGLILSCQRGGTVFDIWRFPLASPDNPVRVTVGGVDAITPATGRRTKRIAWVHQVEDMNIHRIAASGADVSSKFISSTLRDWNPRYSRDGRVAFVSDRSGTREIWMANGDGSGQVKVTNMGGGEIRDVQWSPDSSQVAFTAQRYGNSDIFVVNCEQANRRCAEPRRFTSEKSAEVCPTWSSDGTFLYFASDRTGRFEIWRQSVRGGPVAQITGSGGYLAYESADGQWLYISGGHSGGIRRVPGSRVHLEESKIREERVIGPPHEVQPTGWTLTPHEIFFVDRTDDRRSAVIRAQNLSTGTKRTVVTLTEVFTDRNDIGVDVSPDLRWLLYTKLDRSGSNVMVAEEAP